MKIFNILNKIFNLPKLQVSYIFKKHVVKYNGCKIDKSEFQKREQMLNSEQGNVLT